MYSFESEGWFVGHPYAYAFAFSDENNNTQYVELKSFRPNFYQAHVHDKKKYPVVLYFESELLRPQYLRSVYLNNKFFYRYR